jgi:hypothetical protein
VFWRRFAYALPRVTTIVHGADPYFAWPLMSDGLRHPASPLTWVHTGYTELPDDSGWAGNVLFWADHDPVRIISAMEALI